MAKNKKKVSKPKSTILASEATILGIKSDKFNAQYTDINGYGVDVQLLEKVYLRGSESLINSLQDRVDQFMYLVRIGTPLSPEYTQDFALLQEGQPKRKI